MSKYFTNFEESNIDADAPSGWTKRLAAGTSPSSFVRRVANGTPAFKRRELVTSQSASGLGLITWDRVDGDSNRANIQVRALYRHGSSNQDTDKGIIVRGTGSAGSEGFYYMDLASATSRVEIGRYNAGAFSTVLSFASYTLTAGVDYIFVFDVQGTGATVTLRAKVYPASEAEPTAWNVTTTDTSASRHTSNGWAGIWNFGNGRSGGWNYVSVATNGETSFAPMHNTEFLAYMAAQENPICVLAEPLATGYNSGSGGPDYTKTVYGFWSTTPYVGQDQDGDPAATVSPRLRQYDPIIITPPTFREEIGEALRGQGTVGFGKMVISNPASSADGPGVRDDYLRQKWKRSFVTVLLGAPSWSRHNFRTVILGRLGQPLAAKEEEIEFPILEMTDVFNVPVQSSRFSSGVYADQPKPKLFGRVAFIEPPLTDEATGEFTIDDGAITEATAPVKAYLNGVPMTDPGGLTVTAVDAGTDVITLSAAHGMLTKSRFRFDSGTPPAPFVVNTDYFIESVPASDQVKLALTAGGAAENITSTTTGAGVSIYANRFDLSNGKMYVEGNLAGARVFVGQDGEGGLEDNAGITDEWKASNVYDQLMFAVPGLSRNYKNTTKFTALDSDAYTDDKVGIWIGVEPRQLIDVLNEFAVKTFTWFGASADGLMEVGRIGSIAATAAMSFTKNDIVPGSMKLLQVSLPAKRGAVTVKFRPRFFASAAPTADAMFNLWSVSNIVTPESSVPPLDNMPTYAEQRDGDVYEFLWLTDSDCAVLPGALYELLRGTFEVTVKGLNAAFLSRGDTVQIEYPRFGWKQYTGSDDASPDNTGTVEARLAIVVAKDVNLVEKTVTLKLNRPMPGYYPTADTL